MDPDDGANDGARSEKSVADFDPDEESDGESQYFGSASPRPEEEAGSPNDPLCWYTPSSKGTSVEYKPRRPTTCESAEFESCISESEVRDTLAYVFDDDDMGNWMLRGVRTPA